MVLGKLWQSSNQAVIQCFDMKELRFIFRGEIYTKRLFLSPIIM